MHCFNRDLERKHGKNVNKQKIMNKMKNDEDAQSERILINLHYWFEY